MGILYDFIFGKTTYKGPSIGAFDLYKESVELPNLRGGCDVYFDWEGTVKGVSLRLPRGTYDLTVDGYKMAVFQTQVIIESLDENPYIRLSIDLPNRAELQIKNGEISESVPLW